ncbi:MAG TPA: serine hydrolase domain-containing protein, partial [Roseivirga sp.]
MRKLILSLIIIYAAWSCSQAQQSLTPIQKQQLEEIATQDVPENAPGIATAIIQNGRVIFKQYAGMADLSDSSIIGESTRFNIASNGKQFTALAVLSLIDNKQLKLSDDIRKWFPNLLPKVKDNITVQHLLNHTSGIRDFYDLMSLQGYTWWEVSWNNYDVLNLLEKQTDLNFEPGTKYLYSNSNYILLALLIEKVSKQSFVEYTNEMFKQLNMPN